MILLPLLFWVNLTWFIYQKDDSKSYFDAVVKAQLVCFSFIAVITESLSLFDALSYSNIVAVWIIAFLASVIKLILHLKHNPTHKNISLPLMAKDHRCASVAIGLVLAVTLITALLFPPNNWDSMAYHMARVPHWMSNQTLSFYPTFVPRQNYTMPLAEISIMHLQFLSGSDFFANLIQWSSFLGLVLVAFLIAREMGLDDKLCVLSAFLMSTLPMAILQASSTQNDLVVSFFIAAFALFMLRLHKKACLTNYAYASVSMGLALLTKGSAYLFCAVIGVSFSASLLYKMRRDWRRLAKTIFFLSLVVTCALLLNAGHLFRNYMQHKNPVSIGGEKLVNKNPALSTLVDNISLNYAVHLGVPVDDINRFTQDIFQHILGLRTDASKPSYIERSFKIHYSRHEDSAGNLFHALLMIPALVFFLFQWKTVKNRHIAYYAFAVLLCAIFYCLLLSWNPFVSRIQTPLFALACPLLAFSVGVLSARKHNRILQLLLVTIYLFALAPLFANGSRSIYSMSWYHKNRGELYFNVRPNSYQNYADSVAIINKTGASRIGFYLDPSDDWEYPYWALTKNSIANGGPVVFRHLLSAQSAPKPDPGKPLPQYIIATANLAGWPHHSKYRLDSVHGKIRVYVIR